MEGKLLIYCVIFNFFQILEFDDVEIMLRLIVMYNQGEKIYRDIKY